MFGGGAHSGRGMRLASQIMWKATNDIIARGKAGRGAAAAGEARSDHLRRGALRHGRHRAVDRPVRDRRRHPARTDLPEDLRGPLAAICDETIHEAAFPFGTHVCEVEIDPDLGTLELIKYSAVDDVGRAVNPMIIDGQTHGGIVQGVGQRCWSSASTIPAPGQLLSGSFMDYAMPRADLFPFFNTGISEIPMRGHPLGIRPAGEGGTTPALAVVVNAVVDALSDYGVRHVEMPTTPERIWRAMRGKPARPHTPRNELTATWIARSELVKPGNDSKGARVVGSCCRSEYRTR